MNNLVIYQRKLLVKIQRSATVQKVFFTLCVSSEMFQIGIIRDARLCSLNVKLRNRSRYREDRDIKFWKYQESIASFFSLLSFQGTA